MFSFASKMLNTLIGSEEEQKQQQQQQQQQQQLQQSNQPPRPMIGQPRMGFSAPTSTPILRGMPPSLSPRSIVPPPRLNGPPRFVNSRSPGVGMNLRASGPRQGLMQPPFSDEGFTRLPENIPIRETDPALLEMDMPELDLSHLSDEERAKIQSVMAKAQQLDRDPAPPKRDSDTRQISNIFPQQRVESGSKPCPICLVKEVNIGVSKECVECRSLTCPTCGALVPSTDNKRTEWMCSMCMKRTKVSPVTWPQQHMQSQQLQLQQVQQQQPLPAQIVQSQKQLQSQLPQQQQSEHTSIMNHAQQLHHPWETQQNGLDLRRDAEQWIDRDCEYSTSKSKANEMSQLSNNTEKLSSSTETTSSHNTPLQSTVISEEKNTVSGVEISNELREGQKYENGKNINSKNAILEDGKLCVEVSEDEESDEADGAEDLKDSGGSAGEHKEEAVPTSTSTSTFSVVSGPVQSSILAAIYDHSPGEVYTIPEEEDEAGSPTSGDGVTSLRKRRMIGGSAMTSSVSPLVNGDHFNKTNQPSRSLLRSQRSLDTYPLKEITSNISGEGLGRSRDLEMSKVGLQESLYKENTERSGSTMHNEMTSKEYARLSDMERSKIQQQQQHQQKIQQLTQQQQLQQQQQQQQHQQNMQQQSQHEQQQKQQQQHLLQQQQQQQQQSLQEQHQTYHQQEQQQHQQHTHLTQQEQNQQQQQNLQHQQMMQQQKIIQQDEVIQRQQEQQDQLQQQLQILQQQQHQQKLQSHQLNFYQSQKIKPRYMELQEGAILDPNHSMFPESSQLMQQTQQSQQTSQSMNTSATTTKSSTGTISGMLADFSRALGLSGTSPRPSPSEEKPIAEQLQQQDTTYHQKEQHAYQHQQTLSHQQQHQDQQQLHQNQQLQYMYHNQQLQDQHTQSQQGQQILKQDQQSTHQQFSKPSNWGSTTSVLSEPHSLFSQQLTPQQQQMYQQHMQLQHHAQHLKKIRRSLPHSNSGPNEQSATHAQAQLQQQQQQQLQHIRQQMIQRKECTSTPTIMPGQSMTAHYVGNQSMSQQISGQPVSNQLMSNQNLTSHMLSGPSVPTGHIMSGQTIATNLSISQPVISGSSMSPSMLHQQMQGGTPIGTPQSTPVGTPRGPRDTGGDSSDTLSETDSQKSLRMRRKLPPIPPDQEAAPLPCNKKRERTKSSHHDRFRSFSPLRQTSLDGMLPRTSNLMLTRPSASETNLRKVTLGVDPIPRPGSALGLLQASSVVSSSGMRPVRTDYSGMYSSHLNDLVSCLPPDLRHLLSGSGIQDSLPYGKQLPNYLRSLKEQLREEIKNSVTDRHRILGFSEKEHENRLRKEREKFDSLRDPLKCIDMKRKMPAVTGRSRKIRGHRRQLSDPKIHPQFSPIREDGGTDNDYERSYLGYLHPSLKPPYKAYEYESIDDMDRQADWDSSQSYLTSAYAAAGGALRETAINSVLDENRYLSGSRYSVRRSSDGQSGMEYRRRHDTRKHRKPRSWHPSPYGSDDDDDDQLTREEKKAKIKAEIARRRQQIEENARLHEELLRLARLRESAELGYTPHPGPDIGHGGSYGTSSVLKSIDELIHTGRSGSGLHFDYRTHSSHRTEEDRSMDRIASTFRTDDYTAGLYEHLSDFSPLTDFTPHAMPLLPDMPTRSRKLLEDLGSSPITESVLALPQKGKYGSRLYAK